MSDDIRIHYGQQSVHTSSISEREAGKDAAQRIKGLVCRDFNIALSVACILRRYLDHPEHRDYELTQVIPPGDYDLILMSDVHTLPLQTLAFEVHRHPNTFVVTLEPSAELIQEGEITRLNFSLICIPAVLRHHFLIQEFWVKFTSAGLNVIQATPLAETQSMVVTRTKGTFINTGMTGSSSPSGTVGFGFSNQVAVRETIASWSTGLEQQAQSVKWNMRMDPLPHHPPPVQSTNGFTKEFTVSLDVTETSTSNKTVSLGVDLGATLDSFFLVGEAADVHRGPFSGLHFPTPHYISRHLELQFDLAPTENHTSGFTATTTPTVPRPRLDRLKVQFATSPTLHCA